MRILVFLILISLYPVHTYAQNKILFVTSNQDFYGKTKIAAANHFEEIIVPYDIFVKAGYSVDFISPKGGAIPIGYINTSDSLQKKYLYDSFFMDKLEHTMKPASITSDSYSAIFYTGGGATMYGVPEDTSIQKIARAIYNKNGVIAAICHGTAGITNLKDENKKSLYAGRKITGYPDEFENKDAAYYKAFPFSIDKAIKDNKGDFLYSKKGGDGFYIVDGRFVTGQDPSSAAKVANEVIKILGKNDNPILKNDLKQVKEILMDYIEGTANGQPERLQKAFDPNFNLYTVEKDILRVRSGREYISNIKSGEKRNRIGKIISIDIENDAAIAKAEIMLPNFRHYTDYFLMLKYEGAWKIIHKTYTWHELPKKELQ
ncbi:nuclear transport factor 2 family protein [Flavobacterium artemisiae]|uniref:Nuclear transport factor 2 family protein n=2 Tax=Flavobacterium artemisiae TaxID=2126556 RepID=A0ABW4H9Z2_9FLAO